MNGAPSVLILLDIDSTLVTTGGSGLAAMEETGRELVGPEFSEKGVDFAGRLDTLIIPELLTRHGVRPTREALAAFRSTYARRLPRHLERNRDKARALPGALKSVRLLHASARVAMGLVTGNFAETGAMKLRACGFDPAWFAFSGWGDADGDGAQEAEQGRSPTRDALPRIAAEHFERHHGRKPSRVVVVGDTPHDIRCAKVNGFVGCGVATGHFSIEQLRACGADEVWPTLESMPAYIARVLAEA